MLIYQIVLESRQMLKRQYLPASEQSAAIIDKLIIDSLEHIYVYR